MAILAWWVFEYRGLLAAQGNTLYFTPFLLGMVLVHLQPRITPGIGLLMVVSGLLGILGFGINAGWADVYRQWWGFNDLAGIWDYGWPVYGACALLVVGVGTARSRFWGNPWLRLCGIMSYGIYLWHWLIILWLVNLGVTGPAFHLLALFGSLAAALLTYVVIEQPFEMLGRRLARKRTAGDKFRGVSMVTISVCLIGIYLGLRHIYPIDTNIRIQVEILPSQNTLTQVFITDKRDFFEVDSAYYHTLGGAWQEITLTIPELRVGKIRLDPGDGPGTFRIRSFRIKYPFDAKWYPLTLEEFRPDQGVESAVLVNDELVIKTQPLHTDPFLVYRGDTHQPAIRPWSSFLLWSALATALLLIFCFLLDRVALRATGRLKDDGTLGD
jgi:hypothetical protein